ncbi:MAG TPA: 2-hydroxyacid dehydrogenase [Candidatus Nanopelagicaceae bacterium]
MASEVIWSQWDDLEMPAGITSLSPRTAPLDAEVLTGITFFVPPYMGGRKALAPILRMPDLKVVQLPYAGYENAIEFMRPGLIMCNAAGVHDDSTAELAVGLTIASLRGFPDFIRNQMQGEWVRSRRKSLSDSRIGIVGFGSIGKRIAENLSGFAVEIVPFTRSGADGSRKMSDLDALLPTLDVVILSMPLNEESRHLFDAKRLALMKDGALLVNVARGPVVETDALVAELNSGRILAALDVTDPEPLPKDHPLWKAPGLLISPHIGGESTAFEPRFRKLLEEQLRRFSRGDTLKNIVYEGK